MARYHHDCTNLALVRELRILGIEKLSTNTESRFDLAGSIICTPPFILLQAEW